MPDLTATELEILHELAAARDKEREHAHWARQPLTGPGPDEVIAAFAKMGISIGAKRHCWSRLRRHNYFRKRLFWFPTRRSMDGLMSASYSVGTHGGSVQWHICFDCGHHAIWSYSGSAVPLMPR